MPWLLTLAWRNVWRNRRRSLLTMGAIVFAVLLIGAANSMQQGTYDDMEAYAARLFTGDMQVHRAGYDQERTLELSLEEGEQDWQELTGGTAVARRLSGFGLVSSDSTSAGAMLVGVEPEREAAVTSFLNNVVEGRPFAQEEHGVLLGRTLARNLQIGVGDSVVVLTQGYHGAMGAEIYPVVGLVQTGSPEMDRMLLAMPLATAQDLLLMHGRFTELLVRLDGLHAADRHSAALQRELGDDYEVKSWRALLPEIQQMRALDDIGNMVFYAFLLLLVGFEIFNTATMSVMERVREFGVLQSIGMRPGQISGLVGAELAVKVTVALAAAAVLVTILALLFGDAIIPMGADLAEAYDEFGLYFEGLSFSTRPSVLAMPFVAVGVLSFVVAIYPVLRVRRMSPVEAFRYV